MAVAWQQQIFALDARYNAHRAPNHPNFRTLYIRRRSQLLRENCNGSHDIRKDYLKLRSQLLQQRYGCPLEQFNVPSRSTSMIFRSSSRVSENIENRSIINSTAQTSVVPTKQAEASRAIVGDNTIAENYAFNGVHHIFDQHNKAVTVVKFANNERSRLLCASHDGTLSICEVAVEKPYVALKLVGHSKAITDCDWSANNDLAVSCSTDGSIRLWDTTSGLCLRTVEDRLACPLQCCIFQPANCNLVITGNSEGEVRSINVSTGRAPLGGFCRVGGNILSVTCDTNGRLLWVGNDKGEITTIRCDITGRLKRARKHLITTEYDDAPPRITSISWRSWISREARDPSLLINSSNSQLSLYRVVNNEGDLQIKWKWTNRHLSSCMIHSTFCPLMSFRQGACVVTTSDDGKVVFVDVEKPASRAVVTELQGHTVASLGVSFNYDESLLATSDQNGLVIIWRRVDSMNEN